MTDDPSFVKTEADLQRWNLSLNAAEAISGNQDGLLAKIIYFDPNIPTGPPTASQDVQENWEQFDQERKQHEHEFADQTEWFNKLQKAVLPNPPAHPTVQEYDEDLADIKPGPAAQKLLGTAQDTKQLFQLAPPHILAAHPELNYQPERLEHQDHWITQELADHQPQEHPQALVIAGGSGSGKTYWRQAHPELLPYDAVTADPDNAKHAITEFDQLTNAGDPYAALAVHEESGDMLKRLIDKTLNTNRNLIIDTTGNREPGDFTEQLKTLTDHGYQVRLVYINTPTQQAINNVAHRATTTKRHIPTNLVKQIHAKVSARYNQEIANTNLPLHSISIITQPQGLVYHHTPPHEPQVLNPAGYKEFQDKDQEQPDLQEQAQTPKPTSTQPSIPEPIMDLSDMMNPRKRTEQTNKILKRDA